ncbi:ZIP family metal transporter [Patescibacteria group bacterium]|nr:ZIP family metal transporter [Patescibacteria group bacterium]MBU1728277.1 ZIP family metal transporter [Patescibacteria group bacterium]
MTTIYIYAFASVIIISLISLVGVFSFSLKGELFKKYVGMFISLAIGALLGDAFIHLIPESLEDLNTTSASLLIIGGILIFFVVEKFLHWHHHGEDEDREKFHPQPVGQLILFSDGVHNFIDGIIIGASFLVSIPVGIATSLAVILHEIPQEIGDFAVLIYAGYSKKRALWLNFLSALTAILGVFIALILGKTVEASTIWFLPVAAGGFIYIAMADLIPELHKTKKVWYSILQFLVILVGILIMFALLFLE